MTDVETLREIVREAVEEALSEREAPAARLLSPDEVAKILGVSRDTVLTMARDGRLKSQRLGPQLIRFRECDLKEAG